MKDFLMAALPFLIIGICLALIFANRRKLQKTDDEASDHNLSFGMCIGMCFGLSLAAAAHFDVGIGMSLGMLIGLTVSMLTGKKQ